ncbi:unnamed protein product [Medioppia subpectinata]|uniref:Uncharacterized protein n=1 Tax=Medioppia subpectinata TaxID=1979941 RepID=A0A7R9LWH7_9ACAR|nr:unnamed protein product [Medioppia subpectinata]CAG2122077.1 unnamed protein product [Medioppia subpectinata]
MSFNSLIITGRRVCVCYGFASSSPLSSDGYIMPTTCIRILKRWLAFGCLFGSNSAGSTSRLFLLSGRLAFIPSLINLLSIITSTSIQVGHLLLVGV